MQGNIRAGATKRQAALYRVKINGLSIESVEQMWTAAAAGIRENIGVAISAETKQMFAAAGYPIE